MNSDFITRLNDFKTAVPTPGRLYFRHNSTGKTQPGPRISGDPDRDSFLLQCRP